VSRPTATLATAADRPELMALRHRVFVEEQLVPVDLEQDELDDVATHAVVRDGAGRVVGTGRLVVRPDGTARIGRMAVAGDARGAGVGAALLAVLEAAAVEAGCTRAEVHAQVHAARFYGRAGYRPEGQPFDDAGIPHLAMGKELGPA
jgi:predicted GNAT family N-acyltransferase